MTGKKHNSVTIEIQKLQRIAEYYQFPMAVFLAPITILKGRTSEAVLLEKIKSFEKEIKELCEKYWG